MKENTQAKSNRIAILKFLKTCISQNQPSPTYKEIQEHIRAASPQTVTYHVFKLEKEGLVTKSGGHRSLGISNLGNLFIEYLESVFINLPAKVVVAKKKPFERSIVTVIPKKVTRAKKEEMKIPEPAKRRGRPRKVIA
jgi:DNA-binding transcriptional ArsR family regulator